MGLNPDKRSNGCEFWYGWTSFYKQFLLVVAQFALLQIGPAFYHYWFVISQVSCVLNDANKAQFPLMSRFGNMSGHGKSQPH